MIKILELIDGGFLGGGQVHILSILKNIDKTVFDIHAAAGAEGLFADEVRKTGARFRVINLPKIFRKKHLKVLADYCKPEKFDVVHSHGGVAGVYGRMLKKQMPEIISVHTIHGIHYINSRNPVRRFISLSIEQYLAQFTDSTICVSESDYNNAIRLKIAVSGKTRIIFNGIDTEKYNAAKDMQLLASLGIKAGDFVIGQISRFDEQKNQKLLIRAAARLIRQFDDIKVLFIGSGRTLDSAMNLVKHFKLENNIIFAGEKTDIHKYYPLFDVFVFPSLWEGLPYVLLEAMASGLAVVCSDISSHREIAAVNESALFINPRSADELRQKIIYLYNNRNEIIRLGKKAKEAALKFDEKKMVGEIADEYAELLK